MKLVIQEAVNNLVEIEKLETIIRIADFDVGLRQMLEAEQSRTFVAIGNVTLTDDDVVIQFIDPGGANRDVFLPSAGINNHGFIILNVADAEEYLYIYSGATKLGEVAPYSGIGWFVSNGLEWVLAGGSSQSGGGGDTYQMLTNRSGDAVVEGDVLIFDPDYNKSVKTTTIANDLRVVGIAHSPINDATEGRVDTVNGMVVNVNCTAAAVGRGEFLIASATAGKAQAAGYFRTAAAFAIALTSKDGTGAGAVEAMLCNKIRQAIGGGIGWAFGGHTGAVTTNSQRLAMASETWATVAAAALPAARYVPGGLAEGGASAYCIGGSTSTTASDASVNAYKMPFATEVTAAQVSANLAAARWRIGSGGNSPSKGWLLGGRNSAGTDINVTDIIDYATSTRSAGANLTSARNEQRGQSDGSYIYASGGISVVCDKVVVATGAIGAHTDGNLANATTGYQSLSFPSIAGYMSYSSGATSYSRKLPFSTGVSANTNLLAQDQAQGAGNSNGLNVGFVSGDTTSPYSQSSKLTPATDTYSNNGASALAQGKYGSAYANYGAY